MKGRQIVLDRVAGREAAALLVDGELDDLLIAADDPAPGTVYRAVADRPMKGQGGVFLKTPDGSAYLRGAKGLRQGAAVTVQVTGYAEPGKAIPVTDRVLFKSRYAIVTPAVPGLNLARSIRDEAERLRLADLAGAGMEGSTMGLILRSACTGGGADQIAADIATMRAAAEQVIGGSVDEPARLLDGDGPWRIAWRDWPDVADVVREDGAFRTLGVLDLIDAARGPEVRLGGGATMVVEETRALVAVDVNTGPDGSFAAGLKANIACARALPRALRLRGLGGQIAVDMAPMAKKNRRTVEAALRAAFRTDEVETILAGWTPLGHFELQRKRARPRLAALIG